MNASRHSRIADRERGRQRVGHVTRWTAAAGALAAAVIGAALAQGTVSAAAEPSPRGGDDTERSVPAPGPGTSTWGLDDESHGDGEGTPQLGGTAGRRVLQPPVVAPRPSRGGGLHIFSGGS